MGTWVGSGALTSYDSFTLGAPGSLDNLNIAQPESAPSSTGTLTWTGSLNVGDNVTYTSNDGSFPPITGTYAGDVTVGPNTYPVINMPSGVGNYFVGGYYSPDAPGSSLNGYDATGIVACFTPGTLISTPTGSTPVQDLHIGDLILNHAGESVPVKWIGTQRFHPAFAGDSLPICIRQGALGNDLPLRDLYVSPGHAMYIDDCLLIDAKAMINGTTITQVTQWEGDIEYFHIETQNHEIILAEGTPAETFMDNVSRTCFNNYSEYESLYPQAKEIIELDIPRVSHQRQLPNAIKSRLEAISEVLMESHGVKEQMVG